MRDRGVLKYIDAVGVHGFPARSEFEWRGWEREVGAVRERLARLGAPRRRSGSRRPAFRRGAAMSARRSGLSSSDGSAGRARLLAVRRTTGRPSRAAWIRFHSDEREYHYGLKRADGSPKAAVPALG